MGNYSRDTFDPSKQYTGVRLQQGVPLVDADWNEMNDVIRQEIYYSLGATWGLVRNGIFPAVNGGISFQVNSAGANNISIYSGGAILAGRPVVAQYQTYQSQLWIDPVAAAEAGIDPIPPMTTPTADRTDVVYLDVWDREVNSIEDPSLVNPVIGIETSVRFKREYCYRVHEGASSPPAAPPRHRFMPIALLHRTSNTDTVQPDEIEDLRRFIYGMPGHHYQIIAPQLMRYGDMDGFQNWRWFALKQEDTEEATGVTPISLPHRSRLLSLTVYGDATNGTEISVTVYRFQVGGDGFPLSVLVDQTMAGDSFARKLNIPVDEQEINNHDYHYFILTVGTGLGQEAYINGFKVEYEI